MMSNIKNIATMALLVVLLGFFANFAQNDYGLKMVKYGLAVFAYTMIFFMWNSLKSGRKFFIALSSLFCIIEFSKDVLIKMYTETGLISIFIQFFIIILLWLFPVFLLIGERKKNEKSQIAEFTDACFIFVLGMGYFFKMNYGVGAAALMVLSLPYFFITAFAMFRHMIKVIRQKVTFDSISLLRLFIGTYSGGSVFKINHWPFADDLITFSFILIILFIFLLGISSIKKNTFKMLPEFAPLRYITISFLVLSIYYILSQFSLNPPFFLNVYPIAMYEYDGSLDSNKNLEKHETYYEYYRVFDHYAKYAFEDVEK